MLKALSDFLHRRHQANDMTRKDRELLAKVLVNMNGRLNALEKDTATLGDLPLDNDPPSLTGTGP